MNAPNTELVGCPGSPPWFICVRYVCSSRARLVGWCTRYERAVSILNFFETDFQDMSAQGELRALFRAFMRASTL